MKRKVQLIVLFAFALVLAAQTACGNLSESSGTLDGARRVIRQAQQP